MNPKLQQQIDIIAEQLRSDGYTDVYYADEPGLLMATAPDGSKHAINVVVITDEGQLITDEGQFPDEG